MLSMPVTRDERDPLLLPAGGRTLTTCRARSREASAMTVNSRFARPATLAMQLAASLVDVAAQATAIKLPKNRYTPQQDVQLGKEAAAEVRQQYPIIQDERISVYLARLGDRLVAAAPAELKQPVYEYSFTP